MAKTGLFTDKKQDICPECGSVLVIRTGRHGAFLGCSGYPECEFIRPLKTQADGHIVKVLDGQTCPQCQSTLVLRQGRYGMFIGCGNYPECNHTEVIDRPDETAISCPQCRKGALLQRKSRYGKVFHSCERYPDCQFTLNHKPVAGECIYCHYPLLIEKKTAQGVRLFCASKLCGKPIKAEVLLTMNDVSYDLIPLLTELQNGKVIAYPTEAVFGLGCDPDSEIAVKRLLALKQRPWQKGLILIAADYQQLTPYIDDSMLSGEQKQDMFAGWPGPITWVIPAKATTPKWLTGQFTSLAVRVSAHPVVRQLCLSYGKPLVSTSANLSGLPPCRTEGEVYQQFGKKFLVVHGKVGGRTNPSEIRDVLTGELLRQG